MSSCTCKTRAHHPDCPCSRYGRERKWLLETLAGEWGTEVDLLEQTMEDEGITPLAESVSPIAANKPVSSVDRSTWPTQEIRERDEALAQRDSYREATERVRDWCEKAKAEQVKREQTHPEQIECATETFLVASVILDLLDQGEK